MIEKRGITGLSQKEAVFQIIKKALGSNYQEGLDMKPLVCTIVHHTPINRRRESPLLHRIIFEVTEAIIDHRIKSKWNPKNDNGYARANIEAYANRIIHHWLKKDRRLNGFAGTSKKVIHDRNQELQRRLNEDLRLIALKSLKDLHAEDKEICHEIDTYIMGQSFNILLTMLNVRKSDLPQELLYDLKIEDRPPNS